MAEDTSEIGGDVFNSSHNEEGVVETKDTVELQKGKGLPPVRTTMATTREWSRIDDVQEFPTNAFGDIKFENEYNSTLKPAKYIRLSDDTKPELILKLMLEQWNLRKPGIVRTRRWRRDTRKFAIKRVRAVFK